MASNKFFLSLKSLSSIFSYLSSFKSDSKFFIILSILYFASTISFVILFISSVISFSSLLFASTTDDFIEIKSFIFFDMYLISSLAFDIKLEKFSSESLPLLDELSIFIISSLFGMRIPFCFAIYRKKNILYLLKLRCVMLVICLRTFFYLPKLFEIFKI